jgi:hypothetical protein
MRKYLQYLFVLCAVALGTSSCEKVIDLKLKDAAPVLVIEGSVASRRDSQIVKLSYSVPLGQTKASTAVSDAKVTITDMTTSRTHTLTYRSSGQYVAKNFVGRSGRTYLLKVLVQGKEYTASSTMPEQINIDSVGITSSEFFGKVQKSVKILFTDKPIEKNYYRYVLTINGTRSQNVFSYDDSFTDGNVTSRELFDFDLELKTGDVVEVEMQCVDAAIHRYWQGVDQNENRGGATTSPANPVSNISNGALGYFSANTRSVFSFKAP